MPRLSSALAVFCVGAALIAAVSQAAAQSVPAAAPPPPPTTPTAPTVGGSPDNVTPHPDSSLTLPEPLLTRPQPRYGWCYYGDLVATKSYWTGVIALPPRGDSLVLALRFRDYLSNRYGVVPVDDHDLPSCTWVKFEAEARRARDAFEASDILNNLEIVETGWK